MAVKNKGKFLNNNENLPVDAEIEYTLEYIEELRRCKEDIFYFAENYFYIINLDEGRQKIKLHDAQKRAIRKIVDNRFTVICASRQIGKLLALDTPVPTPNGWTTIGELKDGDVIFDWYGNPTKVIKAHDIQYSKQAYEIEFSNGEKIIAGEEHEWFTQTHQERRNNSEGTVKTTQQIFDTLFTGKSEPEPNHRILIKHQIKYDTKQLPIEPYLLGAWIGDGCSNKNEITCGKVDFQEMYDINLSNINKTFRDDYKRGTFGIKIQKDQNEISFKKHLENLNLLKNKHIPDIYLQSDENQRLELLRGLLDTDGHINKAGVIQFYTIHAKLAEQVKELVYSLGIQCKITSKIPKIKEREYNRCYIVTFKTEKPVFKLVRKLERLKTIKREKVIHNRNKFIYIKNIKPIDQVPMKCITIEHPEQMYLIGKTFIPTHNTTLMTVVCLWYALFNKDFNIAVLANKEDIAKEILERIKLAYEEIPNWLKAGVWVFSQETVKLANNSKIFVSTTSQDSVRGKSINLLFMDEFAHVRPEIADDFFKSVMPTISSSKKSKLVAVSTPKGASGRFYDIFSNAERGGKVKNVRGTWAYEKIYWHEIPGRDEEWKQEQLELIGYDMKMWNQEYDIMFLDDGVSVIDPQLIERMKSGCAMPQFTFDFGDYIMWEEPQKNHIYAIGVDVAEGVSQDYSVANVLDITDPLQIRQVAKFASNKIQPMVFAEKLNQIARSWGRPFLCIERNKEGGTVVDVMYNTHKYDNIVSYTMKNDTRGVYQQMGIFCHQNSKYTGIMNMKYFVEKMEAVTFKDIVTVKEFETFSRKENKTWGAKKGFKDDHVMSLIWALIILERDICEKYLDVLEYDDNGKPIRIADPNISLANELLEGGIVNTAYAKLGGNPTPTFFNRGAILGSQQEADIETFMGGGWRLA